MMECLASPAPVREAARVNPGGDGGLPRRGRQIKRSYNDHNRDHWGSPAFSLVAMNQRSPQRRREIFWGVNGGEAARLPQDTRGTEAPPRR